MADQPIPGPRGWPFIGNLLDLRQGDFPLMALNTLADQYGPIYKISIGGSERIVVSSQKLVNELCDETRFKKRGGAPGSPDKGGDASAPAGLFFAKNDDPNWGIAHRVLMPAFGPLKIEQMFDEMHDIASQLVLSWARRGPEHKIDVSNDFTRLTLDSIALCAMGYRFNSFYQEALHPYVDAMTTFLSAASQRGGPKIPIISRFSNTDAKVKEAGQTMGKINQDLIEHRRANPVDKPDLLNAMINGIDPKTGDKMSAALCAANMTTFLIAGHETTSGMLSFAMYCLLKTPVAYKKVQEEVERVIGDAVVKVHHLKQLKYINAVLRETLRLYPTAPAFTLVSKSKDPSSTLGDYVIDSQTPMMVLLQKLHRDPEVYGDDAEYFRPERMMDEEFNALPPNSWKPFGNGMRGCIGRAFAWQEALLALAMLFQRFNFRLDNPGYDLHMKFALTIKPKDLFIHATLREGSDPMHLERAMHANRSAATAPLNGKVSALGPDAKASATAAQQKLQILYGSNTGTCEALALKLSADASMHGFAAESAPLDSATGSISKDVPTVIIASSYEGQPPDNAIHFVEWLQGLSDEDSLAGGRFAVFGCGHHDWADTFHRIPKLIDADLAKHGASRLIDLGLCDTGDSNVMDQFDEWKDQCLWPSLSSSTSDGAATGSLAGADATGSATAPAGLQMEVATDKRAAALRQEVSQAVVLDARVLTHGDEPEKRHLELQLPTDATYRAGDYLAVLPYNPTATVRRVMNRFGLPWDAAIRLTAASNTTSLPSDTWIAAHDILKAYVELSQPPSKKDLRRLASLASDPTQRAEIEALALHNQSAEPSSISTLDLLERHPSVALPFAEYLALLPPLRIRLYSISSSPLRDPSICSVTYGVLDLPGPSGWSTARHPGVASTYLASLAPGDRVHVAVRPSRAGFHLPPPRLPSAALAPSTPLVMVAAGTGLAPFRGFVQERALQVHAQGGRDKAGLGEALLFVGCRTSRGDRLYAEELDRWQRAGAVELRYAHSRDVEKTEGCRYVQDRVRRDGDEVRALWEKGAKIYICGASVLVREVAKVLKEVLFKGGEREKMEMYHEATRAERIVTDVFG